MAEIKNCTHGIWTLMFKKPESNVKKIQKMLLCIKCENKYKFPKQKDEYLAHLFLEHRLVIADVDEIAMLEDYLEYWQTEFIGFEFSEYCCTILLDHLPDGTRSKNEKYYLLSDVLPKDYEIRHKLKQQCLERSLEQHQFERTDRNFEKECLYCRDIITGLRADFLEHLFQKHFLLLGKAENLVYIDDLLEKVQYNLDHLICLYCEKIFKDRATLKEHMRKKGHKRINDSNKAYDRFFLVNYRCETTKPIQKRINCNRKKQTEYQDNKYKDKSSNEKVQEVLSDVGEGSVDFERRFRRRSEESDSDWSDWNGEELIALRCLFCSHQETVFADLKNHMLTTHHVNYNALMENMNFYQKIKIVNFVRRKLCQLRCVSCDLRCKSAEKLLEHMHDEKHCTFGTQKQWDKPEYFFPTYEDDGLLYIIDDNTGNDMDDNVVRILSEDSVAQINKDAERLFLEHFQL